MLALSSESVNFEPASSLSNIFFDDVNQMVCTVRAGGAMGVTARGPSHKDMVSFRLGNKGEVISIKISPNMKVVAIQRSTTSVAFVNLLSAEEADSTEYNQPCKGKSSKIHGLEWTKTNEILYVTDHGLELCQVLPEKKLLKNLRVVNLQVNWFCYCPQTHILVASSGVYGTTLHPFFIKSGNIVRLPKFEVDLGGAYPQPPKLTLLDRDVSIATIYDRIYILVLRHATAKLSTSGAEVMMYELSKDSQEVPKKTHRLQLSSTGKFALHVLDNLVVVHHQTSQVSLMYDIRVGGTQEGSVVCHDPVLPQQVITVPQEVSADPNCSYEKDVLLYASNWILFTPNIIIDASIGCMWTLQLKLEPAKFIIENRVTLIHFLLHRKNSRKLAIGILQEFLMKKLFTLADWANVFLLINTAYANYIAENSGRNESPSASSASLAAAAPFQCTIIEQSELYSQVFHPFLEDLQQNKANLVDVLIEYLLSLHNLKIEPQPFFHEMLVTALVKSGQFQKLYQLIQYRIIADSKALAFLLLGLEAKYAPALQLTMDMLGRLGTGTEEIVEILLSKRQVLPAVRFLHFQGAIDQVNSLKFVEAAWETDDRHLKYTVFKHFADRYERLKGTRDFSKGDRYEKYLRDFKKLYSAEELQCAAQMDCFQPNAI